MQATERKITVTVVAIIRYNKLEKQVIRCYRAFSFGGSPLYRRSVFSHDYFAAYQLWIRVAFKYDGTPITTEIVDSVRTKLLPR